MLIALLRAAQGATSTTTSTSTGAGAQLFWSVSDFLEMKYLFSILPDADKVPATLLLTLGVQAEAWSIRYRLAGDALFWPAASTGLFWNAVSTAQFWPGAVGGAQFLPWPGRIDKATRQVYEFEITTKAGLTQGRIPTDTIKLDVPDVRESFKDIWVSSTGTRLPITKTFRAIKNVNYALQFAACSTARSVGFTDRGTGGPPLTGGPLTQCYSAGNSLTCGLIDAEVIGY